MSAVYEQRAAALGARLSSAEAALRMIRGAHVQDGKEPNCATCGEPWPCWHYEATSDHFRRRRPISGDGWPDPTVSE